MTRLWPYTCIHPDWLSKIAQNASQDSRRHTRDTNPELPLEHTWCGRDAATVRLVEQLLWWPIQLKPRVKKVVKLTSRLNSRLDATDFCFLILLSNFVKPLFASFPFLFVFPLFPPFFNSWSSSFSLSLSLSHTHRLSFFLVRSSFHIFPQPYLPLFHLPNFLHHIRISSILRVTQSATFSPYHIYTLFQYC
jgi:hypothetical protein